MENVSCDHNALRGSFFFQFLWICTRSVTGSVFADACKHTNMYMYIIKCVYFTDLVFVDAQLTAKLNWIPQKFPTILYTLYITCR